MNFFSRFFKSTSPWDQWRKHVEFDAGKLVSSVAISPDGSLLATSCYPFHNPVGAKHIRFWNVSSAEGVRGIAHPHPDGLSFSPDGTRLGVGGADTLSVLRAVDGSVVWKPSDQFMNDHLCWRSICGRTTFSNCGQWFAAAYRATGTLWRLPDREPFLSFRCAGGKAPVNDLVFHPHEKILACAGGNGDVVLLGYENAPGELVSFSAAPNHEAVTTLSFNAGGNLLATGGTDGCIRVWKLADPRAPLYAITPNPSLSPYLGIQGKKRMFPGPAIGVVKLRWSPTADCFAAVYLSKGDVFLWRGKDGLCLAQRSIGLQPRDMAWGPAGETLAIVGERVDGLKKPSSVVVLEAS